MPEVVQIKGGFEGTDAYCADSIGPRGECPATTLVTVVDPKKDGAALKRQASSLQRYAGIGVKEWLLVTTVGTEKNARAAIGPDTRESALETRILGEDRVEPRLASYRGGEHDEYFGDGKLRQKRGRTVQMVLKLAIARVVRTTTYVLLDADCVLLRRLKPCDFVDESGRGVASFSPSFLSDAGAQLRAVGQYAKWLRWSGDLLGVHRVDAAAGFYGVTPAVLDVDVVKALLRFLEGEKKPSSLGGGQKKNTHPSWWIGTKRFWTEYGLYYLFLEANEFPAHVRCQGQLFAASLWQDTPADKLDTSLLFDRQSYTLFLVAQSIRRKQRQQPFEKKDSRERDLEEKKKPPRVDPATSKRMVLAHWADLEAATDRSLDDDRPAIGRPTSSYELFATVLAGADDLWPACRTAQSYLSAFGNNLTRPGFAVFLASTAGDDFWDASSKTALADCAGPGVSVRPLPSPGGGAPFALVTLFGLALYDKIVYLAPGALVASPAAAGLFDRPSLSTRLDADGRVDPVVFVVAPDKRLSYRPLLDKLNAFMRKPGLDAGFPAFLDLAFPKCRQGHLPSAFYLPDDLPDLDLRFRPGCCRPFGGGPTNDPVDLALFRRLRPVTLAILTNLSDCATACAPPSPG